MYVKWCGNKILPRNVGYSTLPDFMYSIKSNIAWCLPSQKWHASCELDGTNFKISKLMASIYYDLNNVCKANKSKLKSGMCIENEDNNLYQYQIDDN